MSCKKSNKKKHKVMIKRIKEEEIDRRDWELLLDKDSFNEYARSISINKEEKESKTYEDDKKSNCEDSDKKIHVAKISRTKNQEERENKNRIWGLMDYSNLELSSEGNLNHIENNNKETDLIDIFNDDGGVEREGIKDKSNKRKKETKNKSTLKDKDSENFLIKFSKRKKVIVTSVAEKIVNEFKFLCINEELYLYLDELGYYKKLTDKDTRVFVNEFVSRGNIEHYNPSDIEAIIYFIKINKEIQKNMCDIKRYKNLVNTRAGVYDIKSRKLLPHSNSYNFLNVIDIEYNREKYEKNFYKSRFCRFLDEITLGDEELKQRLKEIAGYCLCNTNQMRQFFILVGDGSNGKSVFLNLLMGLLGEENICNIQLNQLSDQKYIASLADKMVNIGSELSDIKLTDTSAIKALVNDTDKIICRPIYKAPFSFVNYCKLIFATNNLPELDTKYYRDQSAYFTRSVIVPFNSVIPVEKQDRNLNNRLKNELDLVLVWALEGLGKIRENNWNLSKCEVSAKCSLDYRSSQSYIERFFDENIVIDFKKRNYMFKSDLKNELEKFCKEECIDKNINEGIKFLHNLIIRKFGVEYKKIRIGDKTRQGYIGVRIKNRFNKEQ